MPAPDDPLFDQDAESAAGVFANSVCCAESGYAPSQDFSVPDSRFEPAAIQRE